MTDESTEICATCAHWRDEHIHVSDNPNEPDGSYCEACQIVGNPDHEFKEAACPNPSTLRVGA